MIEGANPLGITFEEYEEYATELKSLKTTDKVIDGLIERRNNILNGGVNCIPLPFPRFRQEIPGIEQGQYVVITANQKTGKSQWANYVYMFHTLDLISLDK